MADRDPWAEAKRLAARADPCRYAPTATFDTLLTPEEKALVLSGWGGVPWTEVEQPELAAAGRLA